MAIHKQTHGRMQAAGAALASEVEAAAKVRDAAQAACDRLEAALTESQSAGARYECASERGS